MRAIGILQRILSESLETVHQARIKAIFWAACSLLVGGRLALTALGRSAKGTTYPKHCIKRVDRLLGNRQLHKESSYFYKAIARLMIGARKRPLVIIDWTGVGKRHSALVAAVPIDGRSIPIFCKVYSIKKNNNPVIHKRFLKELRSILPEGCRPIIVTDAGFSNVWFFDVVAWGWDFVGRIITNASARTLDNSEWFPVLELYKQATFVAKDLGRFVVSKATPALLRLVIIKDKKKRPKTRRIGSKPSAEARKRAQQPWLLATSLAETSAENIKMDGRNPALVIGYGSYGMSLGVYFSAVRLAWLEKGGIIAYAHVRGGGENGKSWHLDGQKTNKPNTWKDFIACVEYLISERYTSSGRVAGQGGSAKCIYWLGTKFMRAPKLAQIRLRTCAMTIRMTQEW